ncbi:MAG TPA: hypothetical protein PKK91_08120, partial [bacterium]|nr:hypothetical protein [bacterium]
IDRYTKGIEDAGAKISISIIILPIITILILIGIRSLSPIAFIFSLIGFLVIIGILFKIVTGRQSG